jgi:hypothetical protein
VVTPSDRAPYLARWPFWLAGAIVVWGALIAAGAYWRYRDLKKASVILITAVIFALVWVAVSRGRK